MFFYIFDILKYLKTIYLYNILYTFYIMWWTVSEYVLWPIIHVHTFYRDVIKLSLDIFITPRSQRSSSVSHCALSSRILHVRRKCLLLLALSWRMTGRTERMYESPARILCDTICVCKRYVIEIIEWMYALIKMSGYALTENRVNISCQSSYTIVYIMYIIYHLED